MERAESDTTASANHIVNSNIWPFQHVPTGVLYFEGNSHRTRWLNYFGFYKIYRVYIFP